MLTPRMARVPLCSWLVLLTSVPAFAGAGGLDPTFGICGVVSADLGASDYADCIALQSDGRIVVGENSYNNNGSRVASRILRYNADGTLDATVGTGGMVTTAAGVVTTSIEVLRIAIQSDGKIVAVGRDGMARFNPDGTLDTAFGSDGLSTAGLGNSVAIQSDGKFVVSLASTYERDLYVTRLLADGARDTSFGSGGWGNVTLPAGTSSTRALDLAIQSDGRIIVAGTCNNFSNAVVGCLDSNGTVDATFGSGGYVIDTSAANIRANAAFSVAAYGNGDFIVGTYPPGQNGAVCVLARYHGDGSLDTSFGTAGKVLQVAPSFGFRSVALQSDGKIVAVGSHPTQELFGSLQRRWVARHHICI